MLEDPRLSSDPDTGNHEKVVMWSYPIIADGLIYVTDVRNGLYVLEYEARDARQIRRIAFLEGNSNQGDALCFEPVGPPRPALRLTDERMRGRPWPPSRPVGHSSIVCGFRWSTRSDRGGSGMPRAR